MSSTRHHHHLNVDRKARRNGVEEARLLDASYASHSHSSLRRTSADMGTYLDASGLAHDSSYNPYSGLANLNGRRNKAFGSRVGGRDSSVTDSEDGLSSRGGDRVGALAGGGRGRVGAAGGTPGRRVNRPASEMTLLASGGYLHQQQHQHHPHVQAGDAAAAAAVSPRARQPSSASTAASSSRYPATTTATKSRRSTMLSQATTADTYPTSVDDADDDILIPPTSSRFNASSFDAINKNNYPSPPSSIVSSVSPQLYPDTPAQAKRRSMEHPRPLPTARPAVPPLASVAPRPPGSAYGHSEKVGSLSSSKGGGGYVPSKWKEEKKGKRSAIEEEYRPPLDEKEWTPGCGDNIKRSWGEISLALRFGVFRTKKKLERGVRGL